MSTSTTDRNLDSLARIAAEMHDELETVRTERNTFRDLYAAGLLNCATLSVIVEDTQAAVTKVRKLHTSGEYGQCVVCGADGTSWPCPTVLALEGVGR